jgi:hypothetical protein
MSDTSNTLPKRDTYTPGDLASALFGAEGAFQGAKRVRAYLRTKYPRVADSRNTSWVLAPDVARDVFDTLNKQKVERIVTAADADKA